MARSNAIHKHNIRLMYLLYLRRKKRGITKRFWMHNILKARYVEGAFYTLFEKLKKDEEKFFQYFRMSQTTFNYILSHIYHEICKKDTNFRMCIPPTEMLAITIRYLASGCTFGELFFTYRIGVSTASNIVKTTCSKIWDVLKEKHFPEVNCQTWKDIAENYKRLANFPLCMGAIDGKHVQIQNFPKEGSMNFNYKKHHSVVLLAIADSDYKFIYVNIGGYGKDCDSNVLQDTDFWRLLNEEKLHIPPAEPLPPQGLKTPYVFVADDAFPLHSRIMRSYGGHNLSTQQKVFNYRLCRARRFVECAFGILTNKWRIFHQPLILSRPSAMSVIKCCTVLHNIVREFDGYRAEDLVHCTLPPVQHARNISQKTPKGIRTCFANYFMSAEGSLPWQMSKI